MNPTETYQERIDRERAERHQIAARAAADLSRAMSAATAEEWTGGTYPEAYEPSIQLIRSRDGMSIRASLSARKRPPVWDVYAATVAGADGSPIWLRDHRRREETLSANIGQGKSPDQIARDIIRRILPLAEELADRAREARKLELERREWLEATAARMTEATRDHVRLEPCRFDEKSTRRELRHWSKPHVAVTLDAYTRRVKLEIDDLSPETALAMLAQHPAPEPAEAQP